MPRWTSRLKIWPSCCRSRLVKSLLNRCDYILHLPSCMSCDSCPENIPLECSLFGPKTTCMSQIFSHQLALWSTTPLLLCTAPACKADRHAPTGPSATDASHQPQVSRPSEPHIITFNNFLTSANCNTDWNEASPDCSAQRQSSSCT